MSHSRKFLFASLKRSSTRNSLPFFSTISLTLLTMLMEKISRKCLCLKRRKRRYIEKIISMNYSFKCCSVSTKKVFKQKEKSFRTKYLFKFAFMNKEDVPSNKKCSLQFSFKCEHREEISHQEINPPYTESRAERNHPHPCTARNKISLHFPFKQLSVKREKLSCGRISRISRNNHFFSYLKKSLSFRH